jgi:hypothetical protein
MRGGEMCWDGICGGVIGAAIGETEQCPPRTELPWTVPAWRGNGHSHLRDDVSLNLQSRNKTAVNISYKHFYCSWF